MEKTDVTINDGGMSHEAKLLAILQNPEKRILPFLVDPHSTDPQIQEAKEQTKTELIEIVQHLFKEIEQTAKKYHEIANGKRKNKGDTPSSLSGLDELYIPPTSDEIPLDVETIWGQVELQNNALNKLLKKSIKNLAKAPEDIVLLDMNLLSSDNEGNDDEEEDDEENDGDDDDNHGSRNDESEEEEAMNDDEEGSDEDEEAKRIRARMERAMEEAGSDDDDDDDDEEEEGDEGDSGMEDDEEPSPPPSKKDESKEELYDPVAEEMKDGFFDLIDMEDYADEEEDYLPQEAFGENNQENKKKKQPQSQKTKSFHQKQRDGDFLNRDQEEDDDDENFEELYEEEDETVPLKRKKYREDEEIDALYTLYQPAAEEDEKAEDAVNMTAADFFGAPSKKYMERYQAKKAKEEVKDDDDSWGEYDFEQDRTDGDVDNDEDDDDENDNHANPSDNDESSHDEEGDNNDDDDDEEEETKRTNSKDGNKGKDKAKDNSRYSKQQEKLRQQTLQLETEMLSEKPWQMVGESKGTSRPVNSLLEGTPEFEFASKQAPTITVEHTANLEDVIKKRILAEDWDDVVPRELPDVGWHMKRGELPEVSQEKSKLGLGELYEREYLKKAVGYDKDAEEKLSEEDKAKEEMKQLFANLCSKLDGLSNYHFAPRPIAEEVEVKAASTPAIAMEEVLPLHVNDARAVAPEEVYATKRGREGVLRGETEMDQRERKRLRQSKKAARRKARQEKLADEKLISRLQPGLGLNNPYEKRKMREELAVARSKGKVSMGEQDMDGKYGSSGTFFQRLQTEAQQSIKGQSTGGDAERTKKSKPKSSALKL